MRLLIIANDLICEGSAGLPEDIRRQVREADEVHVAAPMLTSRLQSFGIRHRRCCSESGLEDADDRGRIRASGQKATLGEIGEENELHAVEDALADFPADALILAVHPPDLANWHEQGLAEHLRARFDLPVSEILLDRDGHVLPAATGAR